jgi:mono/diheme cytochrome c family protein
LLIGRWVGLLVAATWGMPAGLAAQEAQPPQGVTVERVQSGFALYHGKGQCAACHGELGIGTADGPPLISGTWKLGGGDYDWLCHITRHAGWGAFSRTGDSQPMRGPTVLDADEVYAAAAYVWSISRGRAVR